MSDEDEDQLQEKQGEKKWGNNTSYNEPPLRRRITSNTPGGNLMSSPILVMGATTKNICTNTKNNGR